MRHLIFLFGEAERGNFCTPVICHSLCELSDIFGNPPEGSRGLFYAVQALLYERELIYFRVKEEGFSLPDYMRGIHILKSREIPQNPTAICLPGMGDVNIIDEMSEICYVFRSLLLTTESDLYDYLTAQR